MDSQKAGLHWIVAAGIVGADIGTSIFYGTGILFPHVGYLAPVFVLTASLMMWFFKATYVEGLALSPYNGGAYSMILRTIGRRLAVVAGALTFVSYLATASVSALSGGFYFSSLFTDLPPSMVVLFAFIPIILFGLLNTKGIKEPAKLVTVIAGIHFGLLIIMVFWGLGYLAFNWSDVNLAKMTDVLPNSDSPITLYMLMYGFSAAFLGITGFESAAQIVEELRAPQLETVHKLYKTVIILVSFTAPLISFLCLGLLTLDEVNQNTNNLLSALANKLGGRILMTIVVIDATLTLFAAVNTAFVGFIGLATTMAKQGNLPQVLLKRVAHKYPQIQGYPLIALPFALIAMTMAALVAGELEIVAKVYEIAFLGVMVSFCVGVVLMRNQSIRKNTPTNYLSTALLKVGHIDVPIIPLFSGLVLAFATFTLMSHANSEVMLMLTVLLCGSLLAMAYYRWGVLENRLETRSDLRLGLGKFSRMTDIPHDLPIYILCTGGTSARKLINKAIHHIHRKCKDPFELVIFHAEEGKDPKGFFFELLQRVVSQQIAPVHKEDIVLTVKILPGSLGEGLQTLKKSYEFAGVLVGSSRRGTPHKFEEVMNNELEVDVTYL